MTSRSILLDRITRNLSFYDASIRINISSRRTDILIDAEEICCNLLNMVFDYNLKLQDQFPAVDLADEYRGVAVQVTATNTRSKAQHTLDRFLEYDLHKQLPKLIFFILTFNAKFRMRNEFSLPSGMELRIMNFSDLIEEMEHLPLGTLKEIADYLDNVIGSDTPPESADNIPVILNAGAVDDLSEPVRHTLCFAALLPESGLDRNVFEYGLESAQKKALPDLLDSHILFQKDTTLFLHPDFRNKIQPPADHKAFLDRLWDYEKSWHWERIPLKQKHAVQQSLAQIYDSASESYPERAVVYALRSAELYRMIQQPQTALRLEQKALQSLESAKKDFWGIARAHHFIGECYTATQEHALALKEWESTLRLCKTPLHASGLDLAEAYHNVGKALTKLERYEEAEENLLDALELWEAFRRSCPQFDPQPWMEDIYNSLSLVYLRLHLDTLSEMCSNNGRHLPANQDDLLETLLEEQSKRHIRSQFPPIHLPLFTALEHGFVGRERELAQMKDALERGVKPLVIYGLGGIGKTELAIRFCQNYTTGNVYMVRFQNSLYETIADGVAVGIKGLQNPNQQERYTISMERLRLCSQNDILLIDAVDPPGKTFSEVMSEQAYRELCVLPIRIIFTTRMTAPLYRGIELTPLLNGELYKIFELHGADVTPDEMNALISAVNGHTLSVDLMARTLNGKGFRKVTAEQMLTSLQNNTLLDQQFRKIPTDYNFSTEQASIYEHLRTVFDLSGMQPAEQCVMRCATLLPDSGMDGELFGYSLDESEQNALDNLLERGWLEVRDGLLTIQPVVRVVCRQELQPCDENCRKFLNALWSQVNPREYDRFKFSQLAEVFANAAENLEDENGDWLNRSGRLWMEIGEFQRAAALYSNHLFILEARLPDTNALSTAYSNMSHAWSNLGDYGKALEFVLRSLSICERILPPDHPDLAASYNNVGKVYGKLGDHRKALEYQLKALEIRKKVLPEKHPNLATSYNNVGSTYGNLGDPCRALEYQLKALEIWKKVLPEKHPYLAESYNNVGSTYGTLGDHIKALEYVLKALAIREEVLPPDHPDLLASYNNVGYIYGDLGEHGKAFEFKLKALSIVEKVLPPYHPDLANTYANVGSTYSALGDQEKALEYLLKALGIREKVLPPDHPDLAVSYNNAGYIYSALGDHKKALEYLMKALEIREKVLPPEHPDLAVSYEALGQIYDDLGQREHALEYMLRALEIRRSALPLTHPDIAKSHSNAAWAYYYIGNYKRAINNMRQAVAIAEQSLPPDHPHLIQYRTDLETMERDIRQ